MSQTDHNKKISEAHSVYCKYHRHTVSSSAEKDDDNCSDHFSMFQKVSKTGVIYATSRANVHGFSHNDEEWANMGQGAPETGPLENSPKRNFTLAIPDDELEYGPVSGCTEFRKSIARYYNHLYRKGKVSQYAADNVCVVPGGRAGLTRIMAALGNTQVGYFCPDYTAYEQALGLFLRVNPSTLLHKDVNEALMSPKDFAFEARGRGLGAVLLSNPANPTGQSIEGKDLEAYVQTARGLEMSIIFDEFYSHYYYDGEQVDPADGGVDDDTNWPKTVSSAAYVTDVNVDPIIIVNGLTKNWRCPGFRLCWVVAPTAIVNMLASAGSFLDGGANTPLQQLALPLMDLDFIRKDAWALQRHFRKKRDFLLQELDKLGIKVQFKPTATFYVWGDLSNLPPPLNDCLVFLEECVKHKVICVPGVFFDVNPRGVRNVIRSQSISNVRFSYGPPMRNLINGVKHMRTMIHEWESHPINASIYERKRSSGEDLDSQGIEEEEKR